ncbi:MAG TPA: DUF5057 domain-containing protein [Clostridiales bacterium]|nr:DUF5057 domain-containing protein [Clostridiales bacterium]
MKKIRSKKGAIIVIALFFLMIASTFAGFYLLASAEDTKVITAPYKDGVSELGTRNNPLFILEIVPNKSYSEIGYWIPGCEPVDMEKLALSGITSAYQARGFADCTTVVENKYEFELDPEELSSGEGKWAVSGQERGYYQKVYDGTGNIMQEKQGTEYVYTDAGAGNGQYVWIPNDNYDTATDHTSDQVWLTVNLYSRERMISTHKNTFLKNAVGVPLDKIADFKTEVITVDPTDLAEASNLELIRKADLIYINGNSHDPGLVQIWKDFNKGGETLTNPPTNFTGNNDLSWEAVMAIFNRLVSENKGAVVMDVAGIYSSAASDNNVHKLCIMLMQMGPANFNRLLINTGKIKTTTVGGKITGYYVGKDGTKTITAWDKDTFPDNSGKTKFGDLVLKNPSMTKSTAGEGVYTFDGDMSLLENLGVRNITENTVTKEAFDYYEYYDKYKKEGADPNSARRTSISPAEAVFFLLNREFNWADKTELNILEIQPYDSFIYGSTGWEARYRKLFPNFMGTAADIHVTTMTTYDYIGKIEDINSKYDMIIIGLEKGYKDLQKYNDSNLKGKIYLSIGDRVKDDDTARYSGNDITEKKLEQLKDFMQSGRPVILASGFYTDTTRRMVSKTVDKATYMYDLADVIQQSGVTVNTGPEQEDYRREYKDRIFYEDNFNSYILEERISGFFCKLEFADKSNSSIYPVPYTYTLKADNSIDNATVSYSNSSTLKYRLRIRGRAEQYALKLYIDNNGDGKYNGSLDTQTPARQEIISGLTVKDDSGNSIRTNALKPGIWYTVSKSLDDSYQGIIPWKLEINAVDNTSIRTSEINYTVIRQRSAADKIKIDVLQVVIDAGTGDQATTLNMKTDSRFQRYLGSVAEYNVNITFMTNSQFLAMYSRCSGDATPNKYDFLEDYDMLILGFRDCCSYTNNPYANQNILDFIAEGKSIIFSHDVIWDTDAGTTRKYNDILRKIMGQDRYKFTTGVSDNYQPIYYNDTNNRLITNKIKMYENANLTSGFDKYWRFYTDNSNKLYWNHGEALNNARYNYDRNTTDKTNWETTRISIANRGQITQYPFKINDTINVSRTHTQYYQLDLEEDDIVVWYNLSDDKSRLNGGTNNGYYSSRENDSRNNYYIYNKGNITYTGLGHTLSLTDDEIKLFINTMISAYRAGNVKPKAVVTNEDVYTAGELEQYLFVPSDTDTIAADSSGTKTVTFKVEDESINSILGRGYYVSYHTTIVDPADSTKTVRVQLNPTATYGASDILTTRNIDSNGNCSVIAGKGAVLNPDDEFSIDVPLKYFDGKGQLVIEIELISTDIDEDGNAIELKSISQLTLITKPYFDLD